MCTLIASVCDVRETEGIQMKMRMLTVMVAAAGDMMAVSPCG